MSNRNSSLKLKYIDGDETLGIDYDFNKIRKEFRALRTPSDVFDPTEVPWEKAPYIVEMSTRSTGKTTQFILWGLCCRKCYPGFQTGILRCREEQIMPKFISSLLDIIRQFEDGRYVPQLTDGEWNDLWYDKNQRGFRYCNRDDRGDVFEKEEDCCILLFDIPDWEAYKSGKVLPRLDLIIFDEFIKEIYDEGSFEHLMQIISSVFRLRVSARMVMCANTIAPRSQWYRELEISREITKLKTGESTIVTASLGSPVYIHVFDKPSEKRRRVSSWFFGFKNPSLATIRGDGEIWSYRHIQRIVSSPDDLKIMQCIKLDAGDEFLGLDIVQTPDRGIVLNVHPVTKIRDTDMVLTNGEIWDRQHVKGRGPKRIDDLLAVLEEKGKVYYSDAETESVYADYMNIAAGL